MLADMRFRYMPLLVVLLQGEEVKKKMCLCGDRISVLVRRNPFAYYPCVAP